MLFFVEKLHFRDNIIVFINLFFFSSNPLSETSLRQLGVLHCVIRSRQ